MLEKYVITLLETRRWYVQILAIGACAKFLDRGEKEGAAGGI